MPWVKSIQRAAKIAVDYWYDGIEALLTQKTLQQLSSGETDLVSAKVLSLHQPFRETGILVDKLGFLELRPFPSEWNYEAYLALANRIGVPIVLHINDPHFDSLRWAIAVSAKSVKPVLEFNTFGVAFKKDFRPEDLRDLAQEMDCGICFDVGYAYQAGWDILEAWDLLADKTTIIHFYDVKAEIKGMFSKNLTPGTGVLPLTEFLVNLRESHWRGQITLELLPEPLANHKRACAFTRAFLYPS